MATKNFEVPATVTITNNGTEDVGFRYFRVNFIEVLKPADVVVLTAGSSEEAAYYAALANTATGLTVEVAKGE